MAKASIFFWAVLLEIGLFAGLTGCSEQRNYEVLGERTHLEKGFGYMSRVVIYSDVSSDEQNSVLMQAGMDYLFAHDSREVSVFLSANPRRDDGYYKGKAKCSQTLGCEALSSSASPYQ